MEKNKGITLIALVVTIVVLLILAGVSISMLAGDNGVISQARNANVQNAHGTVYEALKLEEQDYLTQKNLGKVEEDFITVLQDKGIIDSEYVIAVKTLVKEKLPTGAGSGTKDVYKLEESTELGKVASIGEVKIAEEDGNKIYDVVYYDKKEEKTKLGTIESYGGNNDENSVESISEYYLFGSNCTEEDWTIESNLAICLMYDEIAEKYVKKYIKETTGIDVDSSIDTLSDDEVFLLSAQFMVGKTYESFEEFIADRYSNGYIDEEYKTLKEFLLGEGEIESELEYDDDMERYREFLKEQMISENSVEIYKPDGEKYNDHFEITDMGKYEFTIKVNEKEYKFKVSIDRFEIICKDTVACVYDFVDHKRLMVESGTMSNERAGIKEENLPVLNEGGQRGIFNNENKYSIIIYEVWNEFGYDGICELTLKCNNGGYVSGKVYAIAFAN